MSGSKNCPETPRQKMIGMMYLVLTAMLALNVSVQILDGFRLVNDSLNQTLRIANSRNKGLYDEFDYLASQNKGKVGEWLEKANIVKAESDKLYDYISKLKLEIAQVADGKEGNPDNLENAGNLDASGQIGLIEKDTDGKGKKEPKAIVLKGLIAEYSTTIQGLVQDSAKKEQFKELFTTKDKPEMPWEVQVFESMPAAAAITILSKYQNDIKNSEAEIITYLKNQIDAGDYRVNSINAVVVPNSKYVIKGGKYSAQIILSATDSTKKPIIKIGGKEIPNGLYEFGVGATGSFNYEGTIELPKSDGTSAFYKFKSDYTVGEPAVTVSADLMNVFYAGFDNPVSISVPGIPQSQINATATGGALERKGTGWNIKPMKVGQECVITVTATVDGKSQTFGSKTFRVKALPDPAGFIAYNDAAGNPAKYWGSTNFSKALLINAKGVNAELKDADLDVKYKVLGFEASFTDEMGNSIIELSDGANFSDKQMARMKKLTPNKRFYITRIKAVGPDRVERSLPPIEVIVK